MIIGYATAKNGEGLVIVIGRWNSLEEIQINCSCLANDVQITFEETEEDDFKNEEGIRRLEEYRKAELYKEV